MLLSACKFGVRGTAEIENDDSGKDQLGLRTVSTSTYIYNAPISNRSVVAEIISPYAQN